MAFAVPANPERPLSAQTCAVALERLAEARIGSPLLSPDEQAQVLQVARSDVARLCGEGHTEGALPDLRPFSTVLSVGATALNASELFTSAILSGPSAARFADATDQTKG